MKTLYAEVAGRNARIRVPENDSDVLEFQEFLQQRPNSPVAVDTETTGLDIYSDEFRCRAVQIGIGLDAWVLLVEELGVTKQFLLDALEGRELFFQNAAYDVQVLKRCFGYQCDWDLITDTKILAHLIDSRSKKEGGPGLSLQELTAYYLDPKVAEDIKGSMSRMSKETGLKKAELFATIDAWNETYLTYAGMDVVLTWGLRNRLQEVYNSERAKDGRIKDLVRYEHDVARVCCELSARGFLLDVDYSRALSEQLEEEQAVWEAVAYNAYGLESVNSNAEVADYLIEDGVKLNELTATGNYKVSKEVLDPLVEQGNLLAACVVNAKKAKKWRTTWVDKFLSERDSSNRCHANIQPLQARTARMSVSGIPVQQLPSSDWVIRRCFIPEPGEVIVSCDYQAQELRVLAALSGDENMIKAFHEGADLHQMTADASGVSRKVGKTVNFAYVYGSGPSNIAKTCDISVQKAREVIKGFERTYPRVKELSERLQRQAIDNGYIVTPFGRKLLVDSDRPYAALNYMIQSTSRDVTAMALLRLDKAGFTPYLRLPIHDEIVASVPADKAEWGARKIAEIMATDIEGVHIGTDADVYGASWGGGYYDKEDEDATAAYERTFKKEG